MFTGIIDSTEERAQTGSSSQDLGGSSRSCRRTEQDMEINRLREELR